MNSIVFNTKNKLNIEDILIALCSDFNVLYNIQDKIDIVCHEYLI